MDGQASFPPGKPIAGPHKTRERFRGRFHIVLPDGRFGKSGEFLYTPRAMTRNRILTNVVILALGVLSTACSFTTGYEKEKGPPTSYSLTRMGDSVYRIDIQGLESTTRRGMTLELLKRAAQVAQKEGCDYFVVTGGDVLGDNEIRATPFAGLFPESPSGSQGEGTARVTQRYAGSVIFHIFKGEKPADNPLAFDVAEFVR